MIKTRNLSLLCGTRASPAWALSIRARHSSRMSCPRFARMESSAPSHVSLGFVRRPVAGATPRYGSGPDRSWSTTTVSYRRPLSSAEISPIRPDAATADVVDLSGRPRPSNASRRERRLAHRCSHGAPRGCQRRSWGCGGQPRPRQSVGQSSHREFGRWPGPNRLNGRTRTTSRLRPEGYCSAEVILSDLASSVRIGRPERRILVATSPIAGRFATVLLGRPDDQNACLRGVTRATASSRFS